MNNWDPKNSLTGNEFLDFLSWCEVQGIDFEGKEQEDQNEEQQEETDSQTLIKKMKGRDIYE